MSDAGFVRLRALFDAVVELSPLARASYLAAHCGDDAALRHEVEELLLADASPADTDAEVGSLISGELGGLELAAPGQQIGAYRIQRVLGSGGMSTVFLAVQENPHREVALKTMLLGMLSDKASRRFEAESEILGRLHHPAIAQVYEAGKWREPLAGKEIPFFAMEYVEGARPLDQFVCEQALGLADTLQLFLKVCDAVHYGHQLGVIHRDLKPANILVDADGRPKVIDFGIARVVDVDMRGMTMQTQTGHVMGTLQYMPPEQLDGMPHEIDIRSDVYSLGVILHELLAGAPPFDPAGKSLTVFTHDVRMTDSVLPSQVAGGFELRGMSCELDWISRRAIAVEKSERYQSVSELAIDLRRFLANEPVSVGPPSTTYQLRKFVRRNRGLVASAVVVTLVLLAGIATTSWWWFQAVEQRRDAEQQKAKAIVAAAAARRQATKAETINGFFNELLKFADPAEGRYRSRPNWTIREALDASSLAWFDKLAEDPDVESHVRISMGNAYKSLGELRQADEHLQRAVDLRRHSLAEADPDLADAILSLAVTKAARGERDQALVLYREALAGFTAAYGEQHAKVALCNLNIGTSLSAKKQHAKAELRIRRALEIYRQLPGDQVRFIASCLPHLGTLAYHGGEFDRAIELYREGLELYDQCGRAWHPHAGAAHDILAFILEQKKDDHQGARQHLERTLEIYRAAYGDDARLTGRAHKQFGSLLLRRHDHAAATVHLRAGERIYSASYPKGAAAVRNIRRILAATLRDQGLASQGLEVARRGFADAVAKAGREDASVRLIAVELARCQRDVGDLSGAEELLRRQLAIAVTEAKPEEILSIENDLALVLLRRGK